MRRSGTAPLRIAVIIGSTREGRVGDRIAAWFLGRARLREDIELSVIDLADFTFPARYPQVATPQIRDFTGRIGRADGFVVVTPEYNRSFPASLKQAIDYAYDEWQAKPVGFVSYGCRSLGLYAVEQLRVVFNELHTVTMRNGVCVNLLDTDVGTDTGAEADARIGADAGVDSDTGANAGARGADAVHDPDNELAGAAATLVDQLVWWGLALRDARAVRPYVS